MQGKSRCQRKRVDSEKSFAGVADGEKTKKHGNQLQDAAVAAIMYLLE